MFPDIIHRNSVPRIEGMDRADMRRYVTQLKEDSKPWKSIKLVVIGHGRIGKTTLLNTFQQILDPKFQVCDVVILNRGSN